MMAGFRAADRESMRRTIRFMHSWRPLTDKLRAIAVPTVLITGDLGDQQWGPADAQAAAAAMPAARAVAVTGSGHLGPLLVDVDQIASTVVDFWNSIP
jgi:pimeloyl-ACP methyl ester carboxylesterase